jgi:hypothetical protein
MFDSAYAVAHPVVNFVPRDLCAVAAGPKLLLQRSGRLCRLPTAKVSRHDMTGRVA